MSFVVDVVKIQTNLYTFLSLTQDVNGCYLSLLFFLLPTCSIFQLSFIFLLFLDLFNTVILVFFPTMSNRNRPDGDHRSTPPNIDTMFSLKVDNLTYRTRVEDLRRCFEKFGPIGDIYIPRDQFSRSSRGYAFIR